MFAVIEPKNMKPSEQGDNQQQTQPTRGNDNENQTRVTEVGDDRLSTAPTMLLTTSPLKITPKSQLKINELFIRVDLAQVFPRNEFFMSHRSGT